MHKARSIEAALQAPESLSELLLGGQGWEQLPEEMPPMPALRVLDLSQNKLSQLPAWVFQLPNLETLQLKGNRLSLLPSALQSLGKLKRLLLDQNPLPGLPKLPPRLVEIHAAGCRMERFPESIAHCPALEVLQLQGNGLREIPASVRLPMRLQQLDLQGNALGGFPYDLIGEAPLSKLKLNGNPFLENHGGDRFAETLSAFFADAARQKLPPKVRACHLDILLGDALRIGLHPQDLLLDALEASFGPMRIAAALHLPRVLENPLRNLPPGKICLLGHFSSFRLQAAQVALSDAGYQLCKQAGEADLVVLGKTPGRAAASARALQLPIALEGHLAEWLQQRTGQFLENQTDDSPLVGNLLALLRSQQAQNIDMALALMAGGGIPEAALQELLGIRLFHPDPEMRAKAAAAWQPKVPAPLRDAVARAWKEAQLADGLFDAELLLRRLLDRPAGFEPAALIASALSLQGVGLSFVHRLPAPAQRELYQQRIKGGHLQLGKLGLERLPDGLLGLAGLQTLSLAHNQLSELPEALEDWQALSMLDLSHNQLKQLPDAIGRLPELRSLDLSHNRLDTFPESCCRLPALEALRLSHNPVRSLPDALAGLQHLEYLGLRALDWEQFPPVVARMAGLRELDLGESDLGHVPESLRELQMLEGLNLDHNPIDRIPDWLGNLPRLRHLDLSYIRATQLPAGLASAPRLERIYLLHDDSMDWAQVADVLARIPSLRHAYFKRYKIVAEMERYLERKLRQVRVQFVT